MLAECAPSAVLNHLLPFRSIRLLNKLSQYVRFKSKFTIWRHSSLDSSNTFAWENPKNPSPCCMQNVFLSTFSFLEYSCRVRQLVHLALIFVIPLSTVFIMLSLGFPSSPPVIGVIVESWYATRNRTWADNDWVSLAMSPADNHNGIVLKWNAILPRFTFVLYSGMAKYQIIR